MASVRKGLKTRFLPLSITSLQHNKTPTHAVRLNRGSVLHAFHVGASSPRRIRVLFQPADLLGFSREKKGLNVFELCR